MSNSLDQDQDQRFVGPDLGPNCLQKLSTADSKTNVKYIYAQDSSRSNGHSVWAIILFHAWCMLAVGASWHCLLANVISTKLLSDCSVVLTEQCTEISHHNRENINYLFLIIYSSSWKPILHTQGLVPVFIFFCSLLKGKDIFRIRESMQSPLYLNMFRPK